MKEYEDNEWYEVFDVTPDCVFKAQKWLSSDGESGYFLTIYKYGMLDGLKYIGQWKEGGTFDSFELATRYPESVVKNEGVPKYRIQGELDNFRIYEVSKK